MRTKLPVPPRPAVLSFDPEWESMKGHQRDIGHDQAAHEVDFLQRQYRTQWSNRTAASPVELNAILKWLTQKRIPFVLTGAHGIGGWTGRPRGTQDVNILVKAGRNRTRAVNALKALYPELEVRDLKGMSSFYVSGEKESVIDVTTPRRADLEETLANSTWIESEELGIRYRIPSLEEALANKYGAMLTPIRKAYKRILDAADFTMMVTHSTESGRDEINLRRLRALGEMIWPDGGGDELVRLVAEAKAGETICLDALG